MLNFCDGGTGQHPRQRSCPPGADDVATELIFAEDMPCVRQNSQSGVDVAFIVDLLAVRRRRTFATHDTAELQMRSLLDGPCEFNCVTARPNP